MTEHKLTCNSSPTDILTASVDGDVVEIYATRRGEYQMEVYATPDRTRAFARGLLALADEIDGGEVVSTPAAPVKVGDKVVIVWPTETRVDGRVGLISEIDRDDPILPYRVETEHGQFICWAPAVRKAEETAAPNPFSGHLNEAKRLLTGANPSASDLIRLAEILAGKS